MMALLFNIAYHWLFWWCTLFMLEPNSIKMSGPWFIRTNRQTNAQFYSCSKCTPYFVISLVVFLEQPFFFFIRNEMMLMVWRQQYFLWRKPKLLLSFIQKYNEFVSRQTIALDYRNFNTSADSFEAQRNIEFIVMYIYAMRFYESHSFSWIYQFIWTNSFPWDFHGRISLRIINDLCEEKPAKMKNSVLFSIMGRLDVIAFGLTNQRVSNASKPRDIKNHSAFKCWWQCHCHCQLQTKSYTLANTIITFIY